MMTNLDEYNNPNNKSIKTLKIELSRWETKIKDWVKSHPNELTLQEKIELSALRKEGLRLGLDIHRASKKI